MGLFSWSTLTTVVAIAYVSIAVKNLYLLMNPLHGIEVDPNDNNLNPIWEDHQSFSMICYLSTYNKPSYNMKDVLSSKMNYLLWEKNDLTFSKLEKEMTHEIKIIDSSVAKKNSMTSSNTTVIIATSDIWSKLRKNQTAVYLHVLVTPTMKRKQPKSASDMVEVETEELDLLSANDEADPLPNLFGSVKLVKYDVIPKSFRHRYLLSDFGWVNISREESIKAQMSTDTVISYWKPEVAVRLVMDRSVFPLTHVPDVLHSHTFQMYADKSKTSGRRQKSSAAPPQYYYKPPIHVDEIGLTSDKYIPLNSSVNELPLKLSYDTMSLQRWLLMQMVEKSLSQQKNVGFTDKDIDDVRRLISDTSIYLLGITLLASMLHLLFEFLAFQSDIHFWNENKSLTGLSTRALVFDFFSQIIIFLFLIESDTSILVTIPSFLGICIQAWKVKKATGFAVIKKRGTLFGYDIEFSRWKNTNSSNDSDSAGGNNSKKQTKQTDETEKEEEENDDEVNDITTGNDDDDNDRDSKEKLQKTKTKISSDDTNANKATKQKKGNNNKKPENQDQGSDSSAPVVTNATAATGVTAASEVTAATVTSGVSDDELTRVTLQADQLATSYLGFLLLPVVIIMCLRSVVVDKHASWYSWGIGSLTGFVYMFGFVLMCPQLFINHKLKSVAFLPWKFLVYKFLNTFIDDLFAFIIKMPTMHRLSVFRDDIVFVVYLYQRWIYRIDASRPIEK